MKKLAVILTLSLILSACQSLPQPHNIPQTRAGQWYQIEQYAPDNTLQQSSLLAVENVAGSLRFVQTDALGAPISRQLLTAKGWQNDGFIMPNAQARQFYAALLPILNENAPAVYPQLQQTNVANDVVYQQNQRELWRISQQNQQYKITLPDQTHWLIRPIESE